MKNFLSFITLFFGLISPVNSQEWQLLDFPSSESITGIFMVTPDTGFIVTAEGNFGLTGDGGKKWLRSNSLEGIRLESLCFIDSKTGWICGHKGKIYNTIDGGHTWTSQSWQDTLSTFFDIQMINKDTGIVVGIIADTIKSLNSIAIRTTDGGKTWKPMEPMGLAYSEACFEKTTGTLYFMSMGQMNSSIDGGRKWNSIGTLEGSPARTFSIFQKAGIMAGPKGVCGYSVDGGKVWYNNKRGENEHFFASALSDSKTGFIGGLNGLILSTKDGGRTWQYETLPKSFTVLDIYANNSEVYAVGSDGSIIRKKLK
jgi:photosystem II stability/assembly factor-like uncharacterized protein